MCRYKSDKVLGLIGKQCCGKYPVIELRECIEHCFDARVRYEVYVRGARCIHRVTRGLGPISNISMVPLKEKCVPSLCVVCVSAFCIVLCLSNLHTTHSQTVTVPGGPGEHTV